jgi:PAS domain S-box-containing protein
MNPQPRSHPGTTGLHQAIIEESHDAVIFADRNGIIRLWNRGAEIIFGYAPHAAIGCSLSLIIPERFRRAHDEGYRNAMESGLLRHEGRVFVTRAQHKHGSALYVDLSFGLLKDEAGQATGAFAIGRDCTARHLQQKQLAQQAAPGAF